MYYTVDNFPVYLVTLNYAVDYPNLNLEIGDKIMVNKETFSDFDYMFKQEFEFVYTNNTENQKNTYRRLIKQKIPFVSFRMLDAIAKSTFN